MHYHILNECTKLYNIRKLVHLSYINLLQRKDASLNTLQYQGRIHVSRLPHQEVSVTLTFSFLDPFREGTLQIALIKKIFVKSIN